ncbi:MAG TPA: FecR domain-containing protein [Methylomirabilota bacterium]|nr:FecR domain-containing protein [Methylomirabilota bacterium]
MKRRDLLRGLGLLAPALALLLPGVTSAQGATSLGTVTRVSGHVTVSRGTSNEMRALKFKDSLFDHDRIGTGERSSARLLLGGKALVTVRELSSLTVAEQPGHAGLRLTGGAVALAVAGQRMGPDERVEIHLPSAVASARGAVLIVEATRATDPAVSVIHVLSGRADVTTESASLRLTRHQSVTVTDGVMGPITTLTDREVEQLAADLRPDRLRRAEPPRSSASGADCCIGKLYPAVKAGEGESVRSVTDVGTQIGLELPRSFVLPLGPPFASPLGVTAPALAR